jgi:hypothetical protein
MSVLHILTQAKPIDLDYRQFRVPRERPTNGRSETTALILVQSSVVPGVKQFQVSNEFSEMLPEKEWTELLLP